MDVLDPQRLRAFLAVADEGSFSAAARKLGKTQSSVSQAVALLEQELGARLFVRDGRRTRLADAGKALRRPAAEALAALGRARAEVTARGALAAGELVIGTSDTLACHLLPPVFAAFRARHPRIEVRLLNRPSPAVAALVAEGAVDIGVVTLPLPGGLRLGGRSASDRVRCEPLCAHEDVVIVPASHPLARRTRLPLEALAAEPLVLLDGTTSTRAFLDEAFERRGLRPRVAMEMSSVEVLKRLVELGFGLSVVPAISVARERAAGAVAVLRPVGLPETRRVGLVAPAVGSLAPAAAAFAAIARERLGRRAR